MSLVLEALKKLDREKGRDERGFVVMAAAPWPTRAARRWPAWAALGVAAVGAVAAMIALRNPAPSAPPAAPSTAAAAVPVTPKAAEAENEPASPAPRLAPAKVLPKAKPAAEPTEVATGVVPPVIAATPVPDPVPRLQAISQRDGQPIAMIDDHLVRVGDEVGGMRVLAIREAEVDVEVRGRRTTLRF